MAIVKYKNSVDERTEGYLFPFFIRPAVIRAETRLPEREEEKEEEEEEVV